MAVGEVVGAHALRGWLRVRAHQPPAPSLSPATEIVLERDGAMRRARVATATPHGRGLVLVAIEGVTDRDAAEALAGSRVLVSREALPPPAPGEFYYHEVEGFAVETEDGAVLGTIAETFSNGLNDVWVVQGARERLIPVIDDVVRAIDRAGRRVVITPLPGLLEL